MKEQEINKLKTFMHKIAYEFKDPNLLKRALIHRSYLNEYKGNDLKHNERLEFLGDAVLELAVTQHLFTKYPDRPEGELTSFRAALVRTETLAELAENLGFGKFIYMSKGEESTGGRKRPYILANTVEAILGAIYIDANFKICQKFVDKHLIPKLPQIVKNRLDIDPKSKLQEIAQEKYKFTPEYQVIEEKGPDHNRIFTVKVIIKNKIFGKGTGKSKQEAEQNAASQALKKF